MSPDRAVKQRPARPLRLLIATNNPGKLREYRELLAGLPFQLVTLEEAGILEEAEETGQSFAENAIIKAHAYARRSGLPTLADDSGLEVDALGGAPGVYSARYQNTARGDDAERVARLLEVLAKAAPHEAARSARFRCVIALSLPAEGTQTFEGVVEGRIAFEPAGEGGFGYDPVFYLPGEGCTMAQLAPERKNRLSHRARAVEQARPALAALAARLGAQGKR